MINMKIKVDLSGLEEESKKFEKRTVTVGVLDPTENSRIPRYGTTKAIREARGKTALRIRKQNPKLKMRELALILDDKYGVFSNAAIRFADGDLRRVIELLGDTFGKPVAANQQRMIENACIAVVRNPIMYKKFGSNDGAYAKRKGFDWPLVSTSSFLQSIDARMARNV